MKLGFSTNAFVRHNLINAITFIAACGYTGIEILADKPHLFAASVDNRKLEEIKRRIVDEGLTVSNLNTNTVMGFFASPIPETIFEPSLSNPSESVRNFRIEYSKKCIDMAYSLGAPSISITSGRPVPGIYPEESFEILAGSIRTITTYAEENNIRIAMEYEPGLLIESAPELAMLIDAVDHPLFGANLDVGHSWVAGEDLSDVIELLGKSIFHIHLEDIRGRKHYHLIPGLGDLDFRHIFDLLSSSGYTGFVTVELYTYPQKPYEAAQKAIEYLQHFSIPEYDACLDADMRLKS
ncbi:MAG: sugar phosphate isomerase/epimerase [Syntrophorhabdaceae bacterium]|nr:sugar phosphate isomerase/epimerase [Syntrophorhabdaceae bacterium]MDD4196138.1 sugar phosphate isomerase/epimerase [Syntrophorhabdaceae bacterium]